MSYLDGLTFNDVQRANESRAKRWHPGGLGDWSALEWAGAMCGEAGEAANVAKKLRRIEDGIVGQDPADAEKLRQQLGHEIADVVIYAFLLAAREGINLGDAVREKFNAVSERHGFPERL